MGTPTCRLCGADPTMTPGHLERVNAKGQPGVWECDPACDAPPMTPEQRLLNAIFGADDNAGEGT